MSIQVIENADGSFQINITGLKGADGMGLPGPVGPSGMGASIPGGRLTLVSGQPKMIQTADYSGTTLFYAPVNSDKIPVFNGEDWAPHVFTSGPLDEIGLSMSGGAKWAANAKKDVFVIVVDGVVKLGTGPTWLGDSTASRGLAKRNGLLVNSAPMAVDTSATESATVPANQATFVGSICPSSAGTFTALFTPGQNRRCDVWNAYNQEEIVLFVGCPPLDSNGPRIWAPPNSYSAGYLPFNNDVNNSGYYFTGLPQNVICKYKQGGFLNTYSHGAGAAIVTVCKDSMTNPSEWGVFSSDQESAATGYFQGSYEIESKLEDRSSVGSHRAIMGTAGANHYGGVTMHGFDPRPALGSLYRTHGMTIKYLG